MEDATIKKDGKGWRITFADGKSLPISWSQIPKEWDGKNIQVLREKGLVVKIVFGGKEITRQTNIVNKPQNQNNMGQYNEREPALGPYNFVPLNEKLIAGQEVPDLSNYHKDRLSGYIDLNISTKTPLFIRGKNENFLMINGKPIIPGSSIRGLARTLVEIVSFGKFVNYNDRDLYHRKYGRNAALNRKLGFLKYENEKYIICEPATTVQSFTDNTRKEFEYEFASQDGNDIVKIYSGKMGRNNFQITYAKNSAIPLDINNKTIKSYLEDDSRNAEGDMKNLIETARRLDSSFRIRLNAYNLSRKKNVQYIGVPLWFETKKINGKDEVIHFGHCRNYRVPYEFSIGDVVHIPQILQDPKTIDLADSIFGTTDKAGRVYFEDANTKDMHLYTSETALQPKILSSPKPTTFQHYLKQPMGKNTAQKQLQDWGSLNTPIRGYKLYWHRNTPSGNDKPFSWVEQSNVKSKSHPDPIKPIKPGKSFQSRIRFENLTEEGLGALLFVLQLPDGCNHKLGMGKPLGLGSVEIKPALTVINRKERYTTLFDSDGWNVGKEQEQKSIDHYQNAFASHMLNELKIRSSKGKEATIFWNEKTRMQELKTMLKWKQDDVDEQTWLKETRYMEIRDNQGNNEFSDRKVLPNPTEVVELAKRKSK